ncbi:hypothetical protein BRN33_12585, partial [Xanthomonas oryzae pv. oryzae]
MSNSPKLVVPLMVTGAVALLCMTSSGAATPAPAVECIQLRSKAVELSATPAFGGRVLSFNLRGQPNVLKVGAAVEQQPAPEVSAASGANSTLIRNAVEDLLGEDFEGRFES